MRKNREGDLTSGQSCQANEKATGEPCSTSDYTKEKSLDGPVGFTKRAGRESTVQES